MSGLSVILASVLIMNITTYAVNFLSSYLLEEFGFSIISDDKLGIVSTVISLIITYVVTIIVSPLNFGVYENIQNRIYGRQMKFLNIFSWFGDIKLTGKAMGAKLIRAVRAIPIGIISFIPAIAVYAVGYSGQSKSISYFLSKNWTEEAMSFMADALSDPMNATIPTDIMQNLMLQFLLLFSCLIIFSLLMLRYSLAEFIIIKNPEVPVNEAFKKSVQIMKGNYKETVIFYLSFYVMVLISALFCAPIAPVAMFIIINIYLFCAKLIYANYLLYKAENQRDLFDDALGNDITMPIASPNQFVILLKRLALLFSGKNIYSNTNVTTNDSNKKEDDNNESNN